MSELQTIEGLKKTIQKISAEKSELLKENHRLKRDLGILEEEGFIQKPSLPLIKFNEEGKPYCEKHGAMNAYKHGIYRCEVCKTAIQRLVSEKKGDDN